MGASILDPRLADAGLAPAPDGALAMGGVPLTEIADAVGTPTFAYDAGVIRQRYRQLDEALSRVPHRVCYAIKANSNLAVLRVLACLGAGADIVSGGEMLRALAAGFAPADIVFSGVGKTDDELLAAMTAGVGLINVESLAELQRIAVLSELREQSVRIGIRVNPDVTAETHPYIATGKGGLKFGIPRDQFGAALRVIDNAERLELAAIAMHLGSQILKAEPYVAGLERLLALTEQARAAGHTPAILDLGGGLGIRYRDEVPLDPHEWMAPLTDMILASGCTLQVAPGRYLVGSAGIMLSRVVYLKHSGGREIAVLDSGMNDLIRPSLYRAWHEVVPVRPTASATTVLDLVGPVCETGDFLAMEREMPGVAAGDLLAVLCAGAYGFAMSSTYNSRARAAEVMIDGGRWAIVRPRERLVDMFRDEIADPFVSEVS